MAPARTETNITAEKLSREWTSQQAKLAARVSSSTHAVLELDETGETLCIWYWPVNEDGEHIVPSDLVVYRNSHQFQAPHCLCAFMDDHDPVNHCEAAIVISMQGPNAGQYVACCALSKCSYVGPDEARPLEIMFFDGNDIKVGLIQRRQLQRNEKTLERLLKLDSFTQPSLTVDEFHRFLTLCNGCELIMTRWMFEHHRCVGKQRAEVINLTIEEN
ncbi:uncharacterized protein F5891DRAFT_975519 [Suillus fuscotomentosus]|uniref:Uncharacterized protein n=1 Tax=Suillus fuscotomentosus TaxID=1912939 RepID=A0AAD4EIF4_9AGAM|nr:uncharacterized protein F5891DRAFT_975519 [Suillus fuscotomentosus]KAG1906804.1 hypothetical protein F5891DRAFT_975519 [Suillus fuscotomentosus]